MTEKIRKIPVGTQGFNVELPEEKCQWLDKYHSQYGGAEGLVKTIYETTEMNYSIGGYMITGKEYPVTGKENPQTEELHRKIIDSMGFDEFKHYNSRY